MAARSEEHVHFLKMPVPFAFAFAAFRLPAAIAALLLWWPFGRLPPGKRTFFAFFFLRFFFFFFGSFLAFLAFFAFLAFGFLADLRAAFFLAAVFWTVRASSSRGMRFATVVSVATISNTISALSLVP